jgi:methionyl aminopeptidase
VQPADLPALRAAGRIAATARDLGARRIAAGVPLSDVSAGVEAEIFRLGGALAFPVQIAVNRVAAHFCPRPGDGQTFRESDLAKLDVGVHLDGWVVDTATTVSVGDRPDRRRFVAAAKAALAAAIRRAGPSVLVREVSEATAGAIEAHGLRPIHNLCGHGVGRWVVHGPPPIPNQPEDGAPTYLAPGATVAIEVFVTDGEGSVVEDGKPRVFRVDPEGPFADIDPALSAALKAQQGLPFAAHQLPSLPDRVLTHALAVLERRGQLRAYRPLVEKPGVLIAQAEHTIHVHPDRVEVLTAGE